MDLLKDLTFEILKASPLDGVFSRECILVQSPGMTQWVKLQFAEKFGICANTDFPLPSSFIWSVLTKIIPDIPDSSAFTKSSMKWALSEILPDIIDLELYEPLKNYMTSGDITDTKLHLLAGKLADIYDQYLVYRPEWILSWEENNYDHSIVEEHPWQPLLWQKLYDHIIAQGKSPYHRANMYGTLIETLNNYRAQGTPLPKGIPERVVIFGVTALPPRYIDALEALGHHMDIHHMNLNPCKYFWGDIKDRSQTNKLLLKQYQEQIVSTEKNIAEDDTLELAVGNSLLSSLGKMGRDQVSVMAEKDIPSIDAFVDIERDSLLECVQDDILNLEDRGDAKKYKDSLSKDVVVLGDRSVQLHSCYSPMREVEALQTHLLYEFDNNPELTPKEIIVMVPDINVYAPYISAVFGNVPFYDKKYIPFSISDKTANNEHPIVASFLSLLEISESRFSAIEVMELLKTTAILNKFEISSDDYDDIYNIVKEVGVRWGLDEGTAEKFDLPSLDVNSWKFGLSRLLMGYSMSSENGFFNDVIPYDLPMGLNYELIGKLAEFIGSLEKWSHRMAGRKFGDQWSEMINEMCVEFFEASDNADAFAINLIQSHVKKLQRALYDSNHNAAIPLSIIKLELNEGLTQEQTSQQFLAGKVNFCTLMPMRSIPFKFVCLIGMNDGVFPRSTTPENYDLMGRFPKVGDRSRRADDRYMFLEALVSAKESFYLSYVGKSLQDGSSRIPSILIQELFDYIAMGYCLEGEHDKPSDVSGENICNQITISHPMTPYSHADFEGPIPSYSREWASAINSKQTEVIGFFDKLALTTESLEQLNLTELLKFWKLPVKHFFNRRLRADLTNNSVGLSEFEPFEFNGLDAYKIKMEWLEELTLESPEQDQLTAMETVMKKAKGLGVSPLGPFGEIQLDNLQGDIEQLRETLDDLQHGDEQTIEISIPIELEDIGVSTVLSGVIKGCYESNVVGHKVGKIGAKEVLEGFIKQLVLSICDHAKDVFIIGLDKTYTIKPIDKELAHSLLIEYTRAYFHGLSSPLAYLPDIANEGIKASKDKKGWKEDLRAELDAAPKMQAAFERRYGDGGTFVEPHVVRVWPDWSEQLAKDLFENANIFLKPAILMLEEVK